MKIIALFIAMAITPFLGIIQWIVYDLNSQNFIVMAIYHYVIFMLYYLGSQSIVSLLVKKRLEGKIIKGEDKYLHCYISSIGLSAVGAFISYIYSNYNTNSDTFIKPTLSYLQIFLPIAIPTAIGVFVAVNRHNKSLTNINP